MRLILIEKFMPDMFIVEWVFKIFQLVIEWVHEFEKKAIRGKLKQTISTIFCQIFGIFDVSNMPKIWQICLTAF